jgi:hypothetical protein
MNQPNNPILHVKILTDEQVIQTFLEYNQILSELPLQAVMASALSVENSVVENLENITPVVTVNSRPIFNPKTTLLKEIIPAASYDGNIFTIRFEFY